MTAQDVLRDLIEMTPEEMVVTTNRAWSAPSGYVVFKNVAWEYLKLRAKACLNAADLNSAGSYLCRACVDLFVTREGRAIHENMAHGIFEPLSDPDKAKHVHEMSTLGGYCVTCGESTYFIASQNRTSDDR